MRSTGTARKRATRVTSPRRAEFSPSTPSALRRIHSGVTVWVDAQRFSGSFRGVNGSRSLPIGVADVVRAAVTVGGPARGSALDKSLRRAGIVALVRSSLVGLRRGGPLGTTDLYQQLETTEKSGVSFRLGMALAAVTCEHLLEVGPLDHLNRTNSRLASGSKRRADLFGVDPHDRWHVVEAKSRSHGLTKEVVRDAKEQASNVRTVRSGGAELVPATRSASIASLAGSPISVHLVDPEPVRPAKAIYEVDVERFLRYHYSAVPDLLEARGGPDPPPSGVPGQAVGAYLPGTKFWLGIERSLLAPPPRQLSERAAQAALFRPVVEQTPELSVGRDGHVLHLGNPLGEGRD